MKKNGTIVSILFASFIILYEFAFDAVYSRLTGDAIEEATRDVMYGGETHPVLGVIIIAAILSECIGVILKRRTAAASFKGGAFFFLWTLHTAATTIMVMTACKAFGADIERLGAAAGIGLFINIIKELILLGLLWTGKGGSSSRAKAFFADACILFFYCTGYSTGWDVMSATPGANLHQYLSNIPLLVLYTIMAMIFFLMMYLPLRLGYFMTEPVETDRDLARTALSIAMVTIAAMIPLYKPLDPAIVQRYKQSEQEKSREQQRGAAHQGNTPANPSRIEKK